MKTLPLWSAFVGIWLVTSTGPGNAGITNPATPSATQTMATAQSRAVMAEKNADEKRR